jgi:SAM-dependent methyltransferase
MNLDEYAVMRAAEDHHWWYRALRDVIRLHWERHVAVPRPRLLDVGCGTGANLALLAPLSEPAGIDVAFEAVAACRERGLVATAVASAASLPFGPASFDVVLSCDVLGHRSLADRALPLREMARVLRPGGLVLLNLPAFQWLLSPHDAAYGQDHRFTRREAVLLLQAAGFEPVAASYWNTFLFPAAVASRLARRRSGRAGSDLAVGAGRAAAGMLASVLALEYRLLRLVPLPVGLSLFIVGRKRPLEG